MSWFWLIRAIEKKIDEYIEFAVQGYDDQRSTDDSSFSSGETSGPSESYASGVLSERSFLDNSVTHLQPMKSEDTDLTGTVENEQRKTVETTPSIACPSPSMNSKNVSRGPSERLYSNLKRHPNRGKVFGPVFRLLDSKMKRNELTNPSKQRVVVNERTMEKARLKFLRLSRSKPNKTDGVTENEKQSFTEQRISLPVFLHRKRSNKKNGAFRELPGPETSKGRSLNTGVKREVCDKERPNMVVADSSDDTSEAVVFEGKNSQEDVADRTGCCPADASVESTPGCMFSLCHGHLQQEVDTPVVEEFLPLCNGERRTVPATQARFHHDSFLYASESGDYYDDMASLLAHSVSSKNFNTRPVVAC